MVKTRTFKTTKNLMTSLLGKETDYGRTYSPSILETIPRTLARQDLPFGLNLGRGIDYWHLFELSYLEPSGKPAALMGRLEVPASSPKITESKSLKLYLGSLNFATFDSHEAFCATIERDISQAIKAQVKLKLLPVNDLPISRLPSAACIDDSDISNFCLDFGNKLDASLLKHGVQELSSGEEHILYSHLFRSTCPVTAQPDWATVLVRCAGKRLSRKVLLAYLVSYRNHQGFHESCVERIFADLWTVVKPTKLMVQAWFTRRGGIDISPCRTSLDDWIAPPIRLARQ